ncbi:MAG: type I restriction enzyme HsdR N-terminal domain-containing protein [Oligoflexia bacterium]|nr:type I restriction enzyme HsdR N-terminal domain-containing protein [Oligoflexia bacterium]
MARETKRDKLIRQMSDQVTEHLHQLKALAANTATKESDVESWCQRVLVNCLGYTATNGYMVTAQEAKGKTRPDLIVNKNNKPLFIVEIKKLGFDFEKSNYRSGLSQLGEYLNHLGIRWGILSNGFEWKLYDFSDAEIGAIEVYAFDILNGAEDIDISKKAVEELCWYLTDFHESTFDSNEWEESAKEATAFSPESLARAILSVDVVKNIAKTIRGEFELKVNVELLIETIFELVEKGLDDAVKDWNDVKRAELAKYVKSQKRAGRKQRRTATKDLTAEVPAVLQPPAASTTPLPISTVTETVALPPLPTEKKDAA